MAKNTLANARDKRLGFGPGREDPLEEEIHSSISYLGDPIDGGAWWATPWSHKKSDTSEHTCVRAQAHSQYGWMPLATGLLIAGNSCIPKQALLGTHGFF